MTLLYKISGDRSENLAITIRQISNSRKGIATDSIHVLFPSDANRFCIPFGKWPPQAPLTRKVCYVQHVLANQSHQLQADLIAKDATDMAHDKFV